MREFLEFLFGPLFLYFFFVWMMGVAEAWEKELAAKEALIFHPPNIHGDSHFSTDAEIGEEHFEA